jgi:hypothetical protein
LDPRRLIVSVASLTMAQPLLKTLQPNAAIPGIVRAAPGVFT